MSLATGYTTDNGIYEPTVADFSPLATMRLLKLAGIIENEEQYRKDRSPNKPWNDAWGNPLVIAAAAFIAPRHDLADPSNWSNIASDNFNGDYFEKIDETDTPYHRQFHNDLFGGRDYFMKRSREYYQRSRKSYVVVGAIGPNFVRLDAPGDSADDAIADFGTSGQLTWDAKDDKYILRSLWRQISDISEANQWNPAAMKDPIWDGIKKVSEEQGSIKRNLYIRVDANEPTKTVVHGFPIYSKEEKTINLSQDVTTFISTPKEF